MSGVYVHVPFCRRKCRYCDFPSFAGMEELIPAYVRALVTEIRHQADPWRKQFGAPRTIYIGGGTPTFLARELLAEVIVALGENFGSAKLTEFTVEVNPGTADEDYLRLLRELGVNRLSIGVQSFTSRLLKILGRVHGVTAAKQTIQAAGRVGFDNISLDLMYGLPEQTLPLWQDSLQCAVDFGVTHISAYGLQVEEGTAFYRRLQKGQLSLPSPEIEEQMYDFMTEFLPSHGYERYEISNFAQDGFACRHNLGYWQNSPYLGLGAAASSYTGERRWRNVISPAKYAELIAAGKSSAEPDDERNEEIAMAEFAFLALRTAQGINRRKFFAAFGVTLDEIYGQVIADQIAGGLLTADEQSVRLTKLGAKWGNLVFAEFV